MLTIEEQERAAYQAGNIALCATLARAIDLESALADADNRLDRQDAEIAHLKRILRDALEDDSWRERAQAAIDE
jgi:diphthamide synthase (EF-2-diphthine--ammonia ligase)